MVVLVEPGARPAAAERAVTADPQEREEALPALPAPVVQAEWQARAAAEGASEEMVQPGQPGQRARRGMPGPLAQQDLPDPRDR